MSGDNTSMLILERNLNETRNVTIFPSFESNVAFFTTAGLSFLLNAYMLLCLKYNVGKIPAVVRQQLICMGISDMLAGMLIALHGLYIIPSVTTNPKICGTILFIFGTAQQAVVLNLCFLSFRRWKGLKNIKLRKDMSKQRPFLWTAVAWLVVAVCFSPILALITHSPSVNSCYSADVFSNQEVLGYLPGIGVMTLLILDGFYACLMCNFIKTFNEYRRLNFKKPASDSQKQTSTLDQSSPEVTRDSSTYMHNDKEIVETGAQLENKFEIVDIGSHGNEEVVQVDRLEQCDIKLSIEANSKQSAIAGASVLSADEGTCKESGLQYTVVINDVRQNERDNAFQRSLALQKSAMIHIAVALFTVNVTTLAAFFFTIFILLHKFEISPKVLDINLIILTVPSVLNPFIYGFQVRELRGTAKGHLTRLQRLIENLFNCRG